MFQIIKDYLVIILFEMAIQDLCFKKSLVFFSSGGQINILK